LPDSKTFLSMNYQLTGLFIYPIKSLGGIEVESAEILEEGFKYDRRWMLVDEKGKFLSQRQLPKMSLFKCSFSGLRILVEYQGDSIQIPFDQHSFNVLEVEVWGSKLKANEVDNEISNWFSKRLDVSCSLVTMTDVSSRMKEFVKPPFTSRVSMADGYPYLILGTASVQELNTRLLTPLPIDRFRANIIIETNKAHAEDEWEDAMIGDCVLKIIKPCARCIITTIDQQTSSKGVEPLKTLASYRKINNKIYFGANAIALNNGIINKGDYLTVY